MYDSYRYATRHTVAQNNPPSMLLNFFKKVPRNGPTFTSCIFNARQANNRMSVRKQMS